MGTRIVIAGTGSIGCQVGGLLAAAGRDVRLLARPRIADEIRQHGLTLTSLAGWKVLVAADRLHLHTDAAEALGGADLILVTVKSRDTHAMAELIGRHAPAGATVLSLQNGLGNAERLRAALPGWRVLAGMVPFNVLQLGGGHFHQGTSGGILVEAGGPLHDLLGVPHLPVAEHHDMPAVLAGKLLLNLNNALNALSGLTLHKQLGSRDWRRLLADCQDEALAVFARHSIRPWSMGPLPATLLPRLLRLPTPLFRLLARSSLRIDRTARSSMAEDLARGRPTEVAELQGKVVELAGAVGLPTPCNRAVLDAVRTAERAGRGSPRLRPKTLALNERS